MEQIKSTRYESQMYEKYQMPAQEDIDKAFLRAIFRYGGKIEALCHEKNFIVELADEFKLNQDQRGAKLEHKSQGQRSLWQRFLFRAGERLVHEQKVIRSPENGKQRKGWILTKAGYNEIAGQLNSPKKRKDIPLARSYKVQRIAKSIIEKPCPQSYNPIEQQKRTTLLTTKEVKLRNCGFRLAVTKAYDFRCAVCGLRLCEPLKMCWEVEAAHIVPHSVNGKDDVWNGIALCRSHHWAFDIGLFTITDEFQIFLSKHLKSLNKNDFMHDASLLERFRTDKKKMHLPANRNCYPYLSALQWHRNNVFMQ